MKCPLIVIATTIFRPKSKEDYGDCLKEECAWWDEHHEKCSELTNALSCDRIAHFLEAIVKKMPTDATFRG